MKTVIVIFMWLRLAAGRWPAAMAAGFTTAAMGLAACAHDEADTGVTGTCPVTPVHVVVSVDQWGDIVSELGGECARVQTVLAGSSADPHDYEPTPGDAADFENAQLVVVNGAGYDEWAAKIASASSPHAPLVAAAATDRFGANPHVWYDPAAVTSLADRVTAELTRLAPAAAGYFGEQRTAFAAAMRPYDAAISAIRAAAAGRTYAATEDVFDDMAAAIGLQNRTPPGYAAAARNETEPSPADLNAFLAMLNDKGVDVLVYNTQTDGAVPRQLRRAAEAAGIPVVEVTETVAPGSISFEAWQTKQLAALGRALGVDV
jgi:zinc/manganese transport system substrate-binding protein